MKKIIPFNRQNVTNLLAFTTDVEIFEHYRFGVIDSPIKLSKGSSEISKPLPIINSLAVNFFDRLNNDPELLLPNSSSDENIIVDLIKEAFESLGIDYSWVFLRTYSDNKDYLLSRRINPNTSTYSLTHELIELFYLCWNYTNGDRAINWNFHELRERHIMEYESKYKKEARSPFPLYEYRLSEAPTIPAKIEEEEDTEKVIKDFTIELSPIIVGCPENPLSSAWFELYCAINLGGKYSLCTFCGKTFSLYKKRGNGLNKSTCSDNCNRELQKQRNKLYRIHNPEEVREKERLRQIKKRAIDAIESGKYSVEDYAKARNLDPHEIRVWINLKNKRKRNE